MKFVLCYVILFDFVGSLVFRYLTLYRTFVEG